MVEFITNVNSAVNGFVWGVPMLVLLVGTGILMTILTKFFQLSHLGHWFKNTVGGIFHDEHVTKHTEAGDQSISQFQSLCTALAATIGTGNIVGVATAMVSGGPGALVWNFSDIANALMAIPNLICMLLLSGEIAKDVKEFQPEIKK